MCTILSIATDQVVIPNAQPTGIIHNVTSPLQVVWIPERHHKSTAFNQSGLCSHSNRQAIRLQLAPPAVPYCLQWNPPDDNRIRGMGCPSVLRFSTKPMIWLKKQTDVVGGWELVLRTSAQTSNTSGYGIYVARRSSKGSPLYRKLESFPNTWSWPKTRNRWLCHQKCRLLLRMCNADASFYWVYYNQPSKSHL